MDEKNDKGEITETFIGTLSSDSYNGKMSSFQGKTYNFDLKVTE